MSHLSQAKYWTVDEYFAFDESETERRYEYCNGVLYLKDGENLSHNVISSALITTLANQVSDYPCYVLASRMRVKVTENSYFYPDLVIVCGKEVYKTDKETTLLNPTVVIEILSPSTEQFDRGRKFSMYRQNPSLQAYLLVSQDETFIECYLRQADNSWVLKDYRHTDDEIDLSLIHCRLKLADVYRKVDFEAAEE